MNDGPRSPALAGLPLLEDLPALSGRDVLVRLDLNVPLGTDGSGHRVIDDDYRIRSALPTLQWLKDRGASVTACSHLGRPAGASDHRFDMAPVRERLDALLPGIEVLENLRFSPGETTADQRFVEELVSGHDYYVNDAFSASHRSHASIIGPPSRLPSAGGFQLEREVEVLGGLLDAPARPFVAVVGGAKIADKLGVLESLASQVDVLVIGGGMAFTFLVAQGHDVGDSLVDPSHLEDCRRLLESGVELVLPVDVVALSPDGVIASGGRSEAGRTRACGCDLPPGWRGLDIGPETAKRFAEVLLPAATVLWNGPLGVVEDDRFAGGTREVAQAVAACEGFTVVGGGDSVSALHRLGLADRVDFLSTGGGASLEFIERGDLPGLAALRAASNAPVSAARRGS